MLPVRVGVASSALTAAYAAANLIPERRQIRLGLLTYCFSLAQKARSELPSLPNYSDPAVFITEAARIGANAIQIPFGVLPPEKIRSIRELADHLHVALESTVSLPQAESETAKFEAELHMLRELGVTVARTVVFPGRRYEDLHTLDAYKAALESARKRLRVGEPIAKRYGVRLAVENHKDQRMDERVQLLREFESEFIGACIDVGNNIALLEDPVEVCKALLPWALTVHFKDQGLREYEGGFLLADVPLGQGCIDLASVTNTIRAKKPDIHFQLELITRDPLKVPVLTDGYWATFPNVKAQALSETWATVKRRSSPAPFPLISPLNASERAAAERRNIEESFRFAAEHLTFSI
jgi:3-oxoisoapionate decarboxylase